MADTAARRLQKYFGDVVVKLKAIRATVERRARLALCIAASRLVQRIYRGYRGRQIVYKSHIHCATRWFAALLIQRVFRRSMVLHWRDIRLNTIASYVLDRQNLERERRVKDCAARYHAFQEQNRYDSCSDDNEEDDAAADTSSEWQESVSALNNRPYWTNVRTKEKTVIPPASVSQIAFSYVQLQVKILWVVQDVWYEGRLVKYNSRKRKYRIEYEDGDHEWLDIHKEFHRVQIWNAESGSWVMLRLFVTSEMKEERSRDEQRRREREMKKEAFRDARQWIIIQSNGGNAGKDVEEEEVEEGGGHMYMSQLTGELRAGAKDASSWSLQADEMGFPIFVHSLTQTVSYDDPRFRLNVGQDILLQREFVLQELRFALYFCRHLAELYAACEERNNEKELSSVLKEIRSSDKPKQLAAMVIYNS